MIIYLAETMHRKKVEAKGLSEAINAIKKKIDQVNYYTVKYCLLCSYNYY